MNPTRRRFLASTLTAAASAPLLNSLAGAQTSQPASKPSTTQSANDRPRFAFIGVGGQGKSLGKHAARYGDIVAVADVDRIRAQQFNTERAGGKATVDTDYRKVLERKDVDMVVIASPDHWHIKHAVDAMRAGKDVYCEKPLTLTIDEGRILCRVVRETSRVLQVGTQQRSDEHWQKAVAMVQGGYLGKIKQVTCVIKANAQGGPFPVVAPPADLDWNQWLGQTPAVPYIKERCHYTFRWWYEYSGGRMTDWGAHYVDIAQWAAAPDLPGPITVEPVEVTHPIPFDHGRPTVSDFYNTASRFKIRCVFANDVELFITDTVPSAPQVDNGILFVGSERTLFVNRQEIRGDAMEVLKEKPISPETLAGLRHGRPAQPHMLNFVECCRDRGVPNSDVWSHHRHLTTCHLANIAARLGRTIQWNASAQQIVGDIEANSFQKREQRAGFEVS